MKRIFLFGLLFCSVLALAEDAPKKSLWQSFVGFFDPSEEPQGEGELYQKLADLDKQIHSEEQAYSRERRPQKKSRIKYHLKELRGQRDELVLEIEAQGKSSTAYSSSSAQSAPQSSSAVSSSSAQASSSSALPPSSSSFETSSSSIAVVLAKEPVMALLFRDTVYIHDTVFVCDTLDHNKP